MALEAYSAGIVTPAVLSATDPILTLATDYGDGDCPTPWGSPCTTSAGVQWEGTLRLNRDGEGGECHGESYTNSWTDAYADFVAGPLDGAVLTAEGTAEMETSDGCGTFTDSSSWSGSLSVSGSWGALQDDTMEGAVSSTYDDGGYWCGLETTDRWEATSGECTWQSTRLDEPCDDWHRRSTIVEVDGVQVRWDWTVYRSKDGVWGAVASITYVDGVAVSDADEVIPEEYGIERVDADGDGWSAAWDCDDGDARRHPYRTEICEDGLDQDCDDADTSCPTDTGDSAAADSASCQDSGDCDGDGWAPPDDCDDADATVYPGAAAVDGRDVDCDGARDIEADTPRRHTPKGGCGQGAAVLLVVGLLAGTRGRRRG